MKVRVHLFARARDLAGRDCMELALPAGASVRDLRRTLSETKPALANLLERCAVAIAEEFVDDSATIPADTDIAILPPVSGG